MKKTQKHYVTLPQEDIEFQKLFDMAVISGAGRPINSEGGPISAWTPDLLAEAVSNLEGSKKDIDLRTVQLWFQDNGKGVSPKNIELLSRIFGCGDPKATVEWRLKLTTSQMKLVSNRRTPQKSTTHQEIPVNAGKAKNESTSGAIYPAPRTLAEKIEWMLSGSASMNLQIFYWLTFCGLGFFNYIVGTLSVTYSPMEGLEKQVGFIWAPTLNFLPIIVLPIYIYYISDLTTYWKKYGRNKCISPRSEVIDQIKKDIWLVKVNDFSFSFWAITLFCFLFVGCAQWFGIYLPAYISGEITDVQIDRYLVTLVRPDVVSIPQSMALSALGYLYTASYIAVFMFGLLFIVVIVFDYHDICTTLNLEDNSIDLPNIRKEGQKIVWGSYRIVLLGLWMAMLIKLQVTYLSSDAKDTVSWLVTDFLSMLNLIQARNGWLDNTSINHFTTFIMVVVAVTIFVVTIQKIWSIFDKLAFYEDNLFFKQDRSILMKMSFVILIMSFNLTLLGRFDGFSLVLALSILASLNVLSGPKLRNF